MGVARAGFKVVERFVHTLGANRPGITRRNVVNCNADTDAGRKAEPPQSFSRDLEARRSATVRGGLDFRDGVPPLLESERLYWTGTQPETQ